MIEDLRLMHQFVFTCDKCRGEMIITELCFSANGDIMVMAVCLKCRVKRQIETTMNDVKWKCFCQDKNQTVN